MIAHLFAGVFAGTAVIKVGQNYDLQTINLNVGDSISWQFESTDAHSVTQVASKDTCEPLAQGFDSASQTAPFHFYHSFDQPGLFYYASTVGQDCQKGFRALVSVADIPHNEIAAQKWQSIQQQDEARKEEKSNALTLTATLMLLPLFL